MRASVTDTHDYPRHPQPLQNGSLVCAGDTQLIEKRPQRALQSFLADLLLTLTFNAILRGGPRPELTQLAEQGSILLRHPIGRLALVLVGERICLVVRMPWCGHR